MTIVEQIIELVKDGHELTFSSDAHGILIQRHIGEKGREIRVSMEMIEMAVNPDALLLSELETLARRRG